MRTCVSVLFIASVCSIGCLSSSNLGTQQDLGQSSDPGTEIVSLDLGEPLVDVGDPNEEWPPCTGDGSPGCPCEEDSDCAQARCVDTGDGKVCSNECDSICPPGWACIASLDTDRGDAPICLPTHANLCRPCREDAECHQLGLISERCISFDDASGSYCSSSCSDDSPCPDGFACTILEANRRESFAQCTPIDDSCSCNLKAVLEEAETDCFTANDVGTCSGVRACGPSGLSDCDAPAPAAESCDDVDNDCNGEVDEALGSTECGLGECVHTVENCVAGVIQVCDPLEGSSDEVCDGLDNDCDGSGDEELGETNCGLGACAHTVQNCVDGAVQFCDPFEGSSLEVCDGLDNDCDGDLDEEQGTTSCGLGLCTHSVGNCAEGSPVECDPFEGSSLEVCDGQDNDCDGAVDEELGSTSCGVGQCAHTVANCVAGADKTCDPLEGSSDESCDGVDNDCDGLTDEELGATTCGIGVCAHTTGNCVEGVSQFCNPFEGNGPEICDSLDNDCDGNTDEGFGATTCGLGECVHTLENCLEGALTTCDPMEGSVPEVCDGLDNDCDGLIDEDLGVTTCGLGSCEHTINNCVGGLSQACDPFQGVAEESCDGLDNNCNGETDEGLGVTTCGQGVCEHTVANCVGGAINICDVLEGSGPEICDGLDNDCDGTTEDEIGVDMGLCEVCGSSSSAVVPTDDEGCAVVDCGGLDFFSLSGDNSAGGSSTCSVSAHPALSGGSCKSLGECKTADDCEAPSVSTQITAGKCQTITGCSGVSPGSVSNAADGSSCGAGYQNCSQGKCAIFNTSVICGQSISGNQICQNAGFSGATESHGYWHIQCAGPLPNSCSATSSVCDINSNCDCTGCGGGFQTGGGSPSESGSGSKTYTQAPCPGWNKGWLVRVVCF